MTKRVVSLLLVLLIVFMGLPMSAHASSKKLIAITFDDGPGPYTDRLLDGLKAKGVKATFFTLGSRAQAYPSQIKRIFDEGHQLANHGYDHAEMTQIGVSAAIGQVNKTNSILNGLIGGSEKFLVRFPYGSSSSSIRASMPSPDLMWSVDTLDWMHRDAGYVRNQLLSSAYDGAVVLMHDIHTTTVSGVLDALDTLKARGYEFVTVRELFRRRGVTMKSGVSYNQCKPNGKDLGGADEPTVTLEAVEGGTRVTLQTKSKGAKIYYTTDGSKIGYKSNVYTEPFIVKKSCTIRAVAAYHLNGGRGKEISYSYTMPPAHAANPEITDGTLTFTGVPEDETVMFTLDGSAPLNGIPYTEPVAVEPDTMIRYYTVGEGKISTKGARLYYSSRGNKFSDIPQDSWYTDHVDRAVTMGLMNGMGGYSFEPDRTLTRAMLCQILYNCEGRPETEKETSFTDVKESEWYVSAVIWAEKSDLVHGYGNGKFGPDDPITREQFAAVLWRYMDSPEGEGDISVFTDADKVDGYAVSALSWAVENKIVSGRTDGTLDPSGRAKRNEAASMLVRCFDK